MSESIINSFAGKRVAVIGDVMIDRYLFGQVDRISPEAPVPVLAYQDEELRLGGASNVALNIKALDGIPFIFTVLGNDSEKNSFLQLLTKDNLSTEGIISSSDRRTTIKIRLMSSNQQLLRVDKEDKHDISSDDVDALVDALTTKLEAKELDCIIFQDYNKGVLTSQLIDRCISLAKAYDIPTLVDPKFKNFFAYEGVTLFKPNLKETKDNLGIEVDPSSKESLNEASNLLQYKLQNKNTLITLSEHGVYYKTYDGESSIIPTVPRQIADVCGAGDTVISVAALALASGLPLAQIATLSNLAGGQVCEKPGVVTVNKNQLIEEYQKLVS